MKIFKIFLPDNNNKYSCQPLMQKIEDVETSMINWCYLVATLGIWLEKYSWTTATLIWFRFCWWRHHTMLALINFDSAFPLLPLICCSLYWHLYEHIGYLCVQIPPSFPHLNPNTEHAFKPSQSPFATSTSLSSILYWKVNVAFI